MLTKVWVCPTIFEKIELLLKQTLMSIVRTVHQNIYVEQKSRGKWIGFSIKICFKKFP